MKTFAIALFGAVTAAQTMTQLDYDYMRYVSEHNKMYGTMEDFNMRQALFAETDAFIKSVNEDPNSTHTAGHNKFSDWTQEEKDALLGLKNMPMAESDEVDQVELGDLPESWDWRQQGMVTPVKDQGQCGSCWAFSAIEAVESAYMIAGNDMAIMSEQQLVDCTGTYGNMGCGGGWYFYAYNYLKFAKTMYESDYPYTSGTTGASGQCMYDESKGITSVVSYFQVRGTNANLNALSSQPVNVAVAAGNSIFQTYQSGIITTSSGCPTQIDHAIVAVGWGVEDGVQYYIVRNSWSTAWGEDGYIRIETSNGVGVCGINQYVYYPTVR